MTEAQPYKRRALSPAQALLLGTLTVGSLDLLDAIVFFGLRGATPARILQSIAAGLLGRAAFRGGAATAALGLLLHFFIAFGIVCVYYVVSRRWDILRRHSLVCGLLYGVLVFVIMNRVIVPLSAAAQAPWSLPVLVNGLLIHAFGVGLPSAFFARAARP